MKDILELADDPRFIEGIFNYCDRWCERCPFASRCLLYAMEQEDDDDPATRDIRNEAFWRKLESIFLQTQEMILACAEAQGISLDALEIEAAKSAPRQKRSEAGNHPLSRAAQRYVQMVDEWFDNEYQPVAASRSEPHAESIMPLEPPEAGSLDDALAVIRWYQFQMAVKLMRGLMRHDADAAAKSHWQKDSDGSIKVALIGLDRSISAWGNARDQLPEKAASILPILIHLERLRRKTEQAFPNARNFIRPGFDEPPDQLAS